MKPILFNTKMVQAIISVQKTQTRRPIKNITFYQKDDFIHAVIDRKHNRIRWSGHKSLFIRDFSPFQIGDILYVRETWKTYEKRRNNEIVEYYGYKADEDNPSNPSEYYEGIWKPSIHMPKQAARIFLRIKNVSFEKIREITTQDLIKEGFGNSEHSEAKKEFEKCWVKIYGEQSWENGFAWIYEFERITKEEAYENHKSM